MNHLQPRFVDRLLVNHRGFRHLELVIDAGSPIGAGRQRETADAVGILMTAAVLIVRDERILFVYLEVAAQTDTVVHIRRDYGLIEKSGLQRQRIKNGRVDDRITLGC